MCRNEYIVDIAQFRGKYVLVIIKVNAALFF